MHGALAGARLEVEELDGGDVDDALARLTHLVAEVDVVEVGRKGLREASDLDERVATHRRAGGGHAAGLAIDDEGAERPVGVARQVPVGVQVVASGVGVPGVLDGGVAEVEPGAGESDVRLVERRDQLLEPSLRDHLDVVVEEDQSLAGRPQAPDVHLLAVVEGAGEPLEGQLVAGHLPQLGQHLRRRGVVVDHDDLEVVVRGPVQERPHGFHHHHASRAPDEVGLPDGRDDDRHP